MVLVEFSMTPIGKGKSVGQYVARSLDIIDKSGLDYRLNPMGTVVEGEWDEVMALVRRCFDRMRRDCDRVSVSIRIDYRRDARGRIEGKIGSVERRLKRKLKT